MNDKEIEDKEIKYYLINKSSKEKITNKINDDKTIKFVIEEKYSNSLEKVLYIKENFICFYEVNIFSKIQLRDGSTFNYIKDINLKCDIILDSLLFSKNEIIFADIDHKIGYFKLDNEYNICKYFEKHYLNTECYQARIELLKNKKIIWIEEERIYIFSLNIKDSNFIFETKIDIFKRTKIHIFYYEVKSRNDIIFNIEDNYLSIIDSNTFKIKSKPHIFKYRISYDVFIINDNYLFFKKDKFTLEIRSLINFEVIKSLNIDTNFRLCHLGKNTFLLKRGTITKCIFDEKKLDIIYKEDYNFNNFIFFTKIQGSEDLYITKDGDGISHFYIIVKLII